MGMLRQLQTRVDLLQAALEQEQHHSRLVDEEHVEIIAGVQRNVRGLHDDHSRTLVILLDILNRLHRLEMQSPRRAR